MRTKQEIQEVMRTLEGDILYFDNFGKTEDDVDKVRLMKREYRTLKWVLEGEE
jgi:hypothetical protein